MKASSFLTACLLVTALWGCSNTQENSLTDSQRLGIKSCSARGEVAGEISEFGMFVTNQNGSAVDDNGDNAHVYMEHGLWNVPPIAIKSGQTLKLFAYSPYMEGMTVTDIASVCHRRRITSTLRDRPSPTVHIHRTSSCIICYLKSP